ncbi:hypothetical protein UFOVP833_23 [uncultured Caudovirales phage]|uniref:Uncharacterized protein n=1 Tax=uncultured Caudovirales phage TaxID=2100421 RepID=A0A6J5NZF7_9CAUD|nr:hypothetical protein UFOVP833_23 [uncultured Caudovirales phage]CAB4218048.1 hypothetical protein UFOVP1603_2 [uncultured Caudovirales phage]
MDIAKTIETYGLMALVAASGIPRRTLYRWKRNNAIPGEGAAYEMRLNQFKLGVVKLRPKKRKAA